jgi:branched-chain amino acid transport system substrate-binding protein
MFLKPRLLRVLYDVGDDYSQGLTEFFEEFFVKKAEPIVAKEGFKTGDRRLQTAAVKGLRLQILRLYSCLTSLRKWH